MTIFLILLETTGTVQTTPVIPMKNQIANGQVYRSGVLLRTGSLRSDRSSGAQTYVLTKKY